MSPNSFAFSLTVPPDLKLAGAVQALATQAAGYVQLPEDGAKTFAADVQSALAGAIGAANGQPLEIAFAGDEAAVTVTIAWTAAGARQTRQVRQQIAA